MKSRQEHVRPQPHCGYRIDVLVEESLIVELQAVEPIHDAPLLTCGLSNKVLRPAANLSTIQP